jgi:gentisate 1,2-dioxygenase
MYHVYEGIGQTIITTSCGKTEVIDWEVNDTFAVPAWSKVSHVNKSSSALAYLFAVNDRPLMDNLGLYTVSGEARILKG